MTFAALAGGVPPARVRPEARTISGTASSTSSLLYLSPDRGNSRRSPSRSVESFLTVRALGFPREFGFGVHRRGVVVSGLGTVRIPVGTHLSSGNYSCFPGEGCQLSPFSPRSGGRCSSQPDGLVHCHRPARRSVTRFQNGRELAGARE